LRICRILFHGICRVATMIGDFATADREIARLIEAATRLNAQFYEAAGHFLKGQLLVERGEFVQGLLVLRDAFETCDRTGWHISYEEFKGALALGLAGTGQLNEALVALDDAMAAEDCFDQAARMAREQGALFWELRVALSLARLRVSQGRHHEARAPLASVYDQFTEGFATADTQAARALLEGLPP
jgi:hypothetical protein